MWRMRSSTARTSGPLSQPRHPGHLQYFVSFLLFFCLLSKIYLLFCHIVIYICTFWRFFYPLSTDKHHRLPPTVLRASYYSRARRFNFGVSLRYFPVFPFYNLTLRFLLLLKLLLACTCMRYSKGRAADRRPAANCGPQWGPGDITEAPKTLLPSPCL